MSDGPTRRFPRTPRAAPEKPPTIEREKIRHRRPNDMMFDGAKPPPTWTVVPGDDVDDPVHTADRPTFYDEGGPEDEDRVSDASGWDDDFEDDWVLRSEDDGHSASGLFDDDGRQEGNVVEVYEDGDETYEGDEDDDSGVFWEDAAADHGPVDQGLAEGADDVAFGQKRPHYGFASEDEPAGRREARPKPPPQSAAPSPCRPTGQQRSMGHETIRRPEGGWASPDDAFDPDATVIQPRREPRDFRPLSDDPPAVPPVVLPAATGRFSKTRAKQDTSADRLAANADKDVAKPSRRAPTKRHRRTKAAPSFAKMPKRDRYGAIRSGSGRTKGLIAALLLLMLAGGGWYAYRTVGADGFGPLIDRVTALIPLPGASRTATDTQFDDGPSSEPQSAEQALPEREQSSGQPSGDDPSADPLDPATVGTIGPPIPAFKPRQGTTRSLSAGVPSGQQQLAANSGGDQGGEPSIFQQLWQFLRPG